MGQLAEYLRRGRAAPEGGRAEGLRAAARGDGGSALYLSLLGLEWAGLDPAGGRHDAHAARLAALATAGARAAVAAGGGRGGAVGQLLELVLERWEREHDGGGDGGGGGGRGVCGAVLAPLALARWGLSQEEMVGVSGARPAAVVGLVRAAGGLVADAAGRFCLLHRALRRAILARYAPGRADAAAVRDALAGLLRARGYGCARACAELPHQLRRAGRLRALHAAAAAPGVLRAHVDAGLEGELLSHWRLIARRFGDAAPALAAGAGEEEEDAGPPPPADMRAAYVWALGRVRAAAAAGMPAAEQLRAFGAAAGEPAEMVGALAALARLLEHAPGQRLASIDALEVPRPARCADPY